MSKKSHRSVSDADWNQLITLASGFLPLEQGDVKGAMSRALAAHVELIAALKNERISAHVPEGRVTMFVPDEGGVALRLEPVGAPPVPPPLPAGLPDDAPTQASPEPPPTARTSSTFMMDEDD